MDASRGVGARRGAGLHAPVEAATALAGPGGRNSASSRRAMCHAATAARRREPFLKGRQGGRAATADASVMNAVHRIECNSSDACHNITCPFRPRNLLPAPAQVEHRPQQRRRAEVATPASRHLQHAPPVRDIVERAREARVKDPALADAVLGVARLRDDVGDEELWSALDAEQGRRVLRVAWWVPASATRQATILSAPCSGRERFPFVSRGHTHGQLNGKGLALPPYPCSQNSAASRTQICT